MYMRRRFDTSNVSDQIDVLLAHDYNVVQFNEGHIRINGRLDVWPTTRNSIDIATKRQRYFRSEDVASFVMRVIPHQCKRYETVG